MHEMRSSPSIHQWHAWRREGSYRGPAESVACVVVNVGVLLRLRATIRLRLQWRIRWIADWPLTGAGPDRRKEERSVRGRNEQQLDDKKPPVFPPVATEQNCSSCWQLRCAAPALLRWPWPTIICACNCLSFSLRHSQCAPVRIHAEIIACPGPHTHYCGSLSHRDLPPQPPRPSLSLSVFMVKLRRVELLQAGTQGPSKRCSLTGVHEKLGVLHPWIPKDVGASPTVLYLEFAFL